MAPFSRRAGTASVAILAGIVLGLGLTHATFPDTVRAVGLDIWNFRAVVADYQASAARGDRLAAVHELLLQQIEASDRVAELLIAGELTLPDAVTELEGINRDRPDFGEILRSSFPDPPTYRARLARYAARKVHTALADDPSRLAAVSARLEAEYRQVDWHRRIPRFPTTDFPLAARSG